MPVYEFICTDCGKPFEELVLSGGNINEVACPTCQSQNILKKISIFASNPSGEGIYSFGSASSSDCSTGNV
jgi:putative FmdB family regulatory protein